jgi:SAM-dependent methyltransferase
VSNQNSDVTHLTECVACGSSKLKLTLDLGKQPLANSYKINKEDVQEEYPLAINRCEECFHVQLTHAVAPSLMFEDYLYVSGTSKTMHDHMETFAKFASEVSSSHKKVLDIGCNDGLLLDKFALHGSKCYGIDPSPAAKIAKIKGHEIKCSMFNSEYIEKIFRVNQVLKFF